MVTFSPPDSPPPAHPASTPSTPSWPPPPRPPRPSSSRNQASETLYWGSAAPASLNSRKAPPRKGRGTYDPPTSPPPPIVRPTSAPVLLTDGVCCCCATKVRYPRSSGSFRCVTCDTVVDLNEEQRRGKAREGAFFLLLLAVHLPELTSRRTQVSLPAKLPPSLKNSGSPSFLASKNEQKNRTKLSLADSRISTWRAQKEELSTTIATTLKTFSSPTSSPPSRTSLPSKHLSVLLLLFPPPLLPLSLDIRPSFESTTSYESDLPRWRSCEEWWKGC
jgi:hypothetical protein